MHDHKNPVQFTEFDALGICCILLCCALLLQCQCVARRVALMMFSCIVFDNYMALKQQSTKRKHSHAIKNTALVKIFKRLENDKNHKTTSAQRKKKKREQSNEKKWIWRSKAKKKKENQQPNDISNKSLKRNTKISFTLFSTPCALYFCSFIPHNRLCFFFFLNASR